MKKRPTLSANCTALGCALIALWASNTPPAFGQTIDESFNPEPTGIAFGLAVQPDNKIVIGGDVGLRRLNSDGSTDTSFGPGLNPEGQVYAIAVQSDGKIVVGGTFNTLGGQARTNIGRLNPDGSLDAMFVGQIGAYPHEWVGSLYLPPDGKILASGFFNSTSGQAPIGFRRFHADGRVDETFHPPATGFVPSFALQPDGKILVAFTGVRRLNPDGSLDASFPLVQGDAFSAVGVALQPDGKIVMAGDFTALNGQPRGRIARLNPDGSLDESFNPGANGLVASLALQADGRILVAGAFTILGGQPRSRVGRLNPDGTVDDSFVPPPNNDAAYLALQADGKILVAGDFLRRLLNNIPALQTLALDCTGTKVIWSRGGSAPEIVQAAFEQSTDGANYSLLGHGTRVPGGWELAGVSLPTGQSAYIRARGRVAGMLGGGGQSVGLIEFTQPFRAPLDKTPPTLVCPSDLARDFESAAGAVVTFAAEAIDDCSGPLSVNCVPPSGTQFPIGASRVICSGSDTSGNRAECGFQVTVWGARGVIRDVAEVLVILRGGVIYSQDRLRLGDAVNHLNQALASDLWMDEIHLEPRQGSRTFRELRETIRALEVLQNDRHSRISAVTLQALIDRLVKAARLLALVNVAEAEDAGSDSSKLREELSRGDAGVANGNEEGAIKHFQHAWHRAVLHNE